MIESTRTYGGSPRSGSNLIVMQTLRRLCYAIVILGLLLSAGQLSAQETDPSQLKSADGNGGSAFVLARVKYRGGGDWYNDPSAEVNLLEFVRKISGLEVRPTFEYVDLASDRLYDYPVVFMTGHGNVVFSVAEVGRLRSYLNNGGFLYIDDDYGADTAIQREMRRVFPDQAMRELPFTHPIYHTVFDFPNGLPKIHEHDGKAPRGLALFDKRKRLCVFYTVETNPSDGWADPEAHNDPPERRETAFRIGTNIIVYALTN